MIDRNGRCRRSCGAVFATLALGGCDVSGAPSYVLFGAFFPAWMFCALLGIFVAISARILCVTLNWARIFPHQLLVHASLGLCAALLTWLVLFGR